MAPPSDGFVLVIGGDAASPRVAEILALLSRRFGEAQWFCSWPERIDGGWACARGGIVTRHYLFDGERGEVVVDDGEPTVAERELGFFVDDPRDQSDDLVKWWPSHGDVLALAARWGLDPRAFGQHARPAVGVIGRI
ncbi:MAG: hypothetical protein IPK26_20070 [Planctomycetes bacterium]|nr:hypothetical protein [Planctomycetota bacterium]